MAIGFTQLLSLGATTTVVGGLAGGGYIAYKNRNAIVKAFASEPVTHKPKFVQNPEGLLDAGAVDESVDVNVGDVEVEQGLNVAVKQRVTVEGGVSDVQTSPPTQPLSPAQPIVEVQDVVNLDEVIEEVEKDTTPSNIAVENAESSNTSTVLDGGEPIYVVAKFTEVTTNKKTGQQVFDDSKNERKYVCKYTQQDTRSFSNNVCEIFKLSNEANKDELIDFPKVEASQQIKQQTDLKNNKHHLLKLSSNFFRQVSANGQITLLNTEDSPYTFGAFSDFFEVKKGLQTLTKDVVSSNLFTAFVTKVANPITNPILYTDKAYKCQLADQNPIECKFYKLDSNNGSYTKTNLDGVAQITTPSTEIEADKYIFIELASESKTTQQLQGKFQIFKEADLSTPIVTGVAEQLVVGKLDASANSNLFIPKDSFGVLTPNTSSDTEKAYIITKPIVINEYLKKGASYTSSDYFCRVIEGNNKHDDEDCKLFKYPPETSKKHFDISDYTGSTDITDYADLTFDKYQVIELKKSLQTALKETDAALYLIRKDRKDKLLNNKVFTLSKVHDFTDETSTKDSLKANLLLVRYKAELVTPPAKPSTAAVIKTIDQKAEITCQIGSDTTDLPCKIYKFKGIKRNNTIVTKDIADLTTPDKISFTPALHYAIELTSIKKGKTDLENKTITVKQGSAVIGKFEFDSLIFGKAKVGGLQDKRDEVSYLVERTDKLPWKKLNNANSYRCKLPASTTEGTEKADNFDFECKLVKIDRPTDNKINTYSSIKSLTDKLEASTLGTIEDKFFKLVFDKKLFYNFPTTLTTTTQITLEVLVDTKKHSKTLKVLGKIAEPSTSGSSTEVFTTSTSVGFFEIKTDPTKSQNTPDTSSEQDPKCSFEGSDSVKFDCTIYQVDPSSKPTNADNIKPTSSMSKPYSELKKDAVFAIDFKTPKPLTEIKGKKITYHYSKKDDTASSTEPPTEKWEDWTAESTMNGLLLGTITNNKQLFFVEDPTFST